MPDTTYYYNVDTSGANAPSLTFTTVARPTVPANVGPFSVMTNALVTGMAQYSDAPGVTLGTAASPIPGQFAGDTYIQTANSGRLSYSGGLTFSVNQNATIYVLYDSLSTSVPSCTVSGGGSLLSYTQVPGATVKNNDGAGHTFYVYAAVVTVGSNNTLNPLTVLVTKRE